MKNTILLFSFILSGHAFAFPNAEYQQALKQVQKDGAATMSCIKKQYQLAKTLKSEIPALISSLVKERDDLIENHCNKSVSVLGEMIELEKLRTKKLIEIVKYKFINTDQFLKAFDPFVTDKQWDSKKVLVDYATLDDLKNNFAKDMSELLEAKKKLKDRLPLSQEAGVCEAEFKQQLSSTYRLAYYSEQQNKLQN